MIKKFRKTLLNLANYSAMKEVDKMSENEKKIFCIEFEKNLEKDPELKKMYEEYIK